MTTAAAEEDLTVRELGGRLCRCGGLKQKGQTFCVACFGRLPPELQRDLYREPNRKSYLAAYAAAVAYLKRED